MSKYEPAKLPAGKKTAIELAKQYETFAVTARGYDRHGTAKEFELTALLLRAYAERLP
jgi:hypothetical protein